MNMNIPHANDVLFGRGKGAYKHEGNVVFRELVNTYKVILTHMVIISKNSINSFYLYYHFWIKTVAQTGTKKQYISIKEVGFGGLTNTN